MHYKNGREAKNGDKVVLLMASAWDPADGKPTAFMPTVGILYDAVAGNDHCNGKLAPIGANDPMPDLKNCLHLDDLLAALPESVPDASKVKT